MDGEGQGEWPTGWTRTALLGLGAFCGTMLMAEAIHLYKT